MKSRIAQSLSLWRLHSLLRAAILNAILRLPRPGKIAARFAEVIRHVCDPPFKYDVRRRVPSVEKAKRLLGFEALTPLDAILDEVIPWIARQVDAGPI